MRVLLVTPCLPAPQAHHGGAVYLGVLAQALAQRAELGLVASHTREELPGPRHGFAYQALVERREHRHLRPAALALHRARMAWRWGRGLPLLPAKVRSRALIGAIQSAVTEFRPDGALVEFASMAQFLPLLGRIPTVFTDHEAGAPLVGGFPAGSWAARRNDALWDRYVRHYYPMADRVQALTPEDAEALGSRLGIEVGVRPPLVPLPAAAVAPDRAPPVALFVGDYRHPPNPEAAAILVREVWPAVRAALPAAELWFAGSHGETVLEALGCADGVRVLGFVPDLGALLARCRLLLAPVFSGGGARIKVLTALAHGLPVVTNELGCRGVCAGEPALARCADVTELVDAATALLRDSAAAGSAGRAARLWAEDRLAPTQVAADQLDVLAEETRRARSSN